VSLPKPRQKKSFVLGGGAVDEAREARRTESSHPFETPRDKALESETLTSSEIILT